MATRTKKLITPDQKLRAFALFTMATDHYAKAQQFEGALAEMLGYDETYCGCISDEMVNGGNFDRGLKGEEFEIKAPSKRASRR